MPAVLAGCCVVANGRYLYVIEGYGSNGPVITVYGLCLETQEWTIMALMDTAWDGFAAALYLPIWRLQ